MKSSRSIHALAVALLATFAELNGFACPHCNIFNYLYPSIRSSPDIVVGKVERPIDEYTASVRIVRVIRGTNQPGGLAVFQMHDASNHLGQQFIFSNPTECCPDFPTLPIDGEWEVAFMVRNAPFDPQEPFGFYGETGGEVAVEQTPKKGRPIVKDAREAVQCMKGVSYVTWEFGLQYGRAHPKQTIPLLKEELLSWMSDFSRQETNSIADHRIAGLVEAFWKIESRTAHRIFAEDLTKRFAREPDKIQISDKSRDATLEASFVESVLKFAGETGNGEPFRKQVLQTFPNLRDQSLVNAIYALGHSKLVTLSKVEETVQEILTQSPEQHVPVALGYYQIGAEYARWWARKEAAEALSLAKNHSDKAGNDQLKAYIAAEMERVNR